MFTFPTDWIAMLHLRTMLWYCGGAKLAYNAKQEPLWGIMYRAFPSIHTLVGMNGIWVAFIYCLGELFCLGWSQAKKASVLQEWVWWEKMWVDGQFGLWKRLEHLIPSCSPVCQTWQAVCGYLIKANYSARWIIFVRVVVAMFDHLSCSLKYFMWDFKGYVLTGGSWWFSVCLGWNILTATAALGLIKPIQVYCNKHRWLDEAGCLHQ